MSDILHKVELHIKRAQSAKEEILQWGDFSRQIFDDPNKVKTVDSFIYRFIKLQDLAGQKLFRVFLEEIGDYRDDMSLLDVLDRLEKLGIIENSDRWMEFRKLRNTLTHEYPDNEDEIVEGIKLSLAAFDSTVTIIDVLKNRRKR